MHAKPGGKIETLWNRGEYGFVTLAFKIVQPNGVKASISQSSVKVELSRSARIKEVCLSKNNASVSQTIEAPPRLNLLRRAAMERVDYNLYSGTPEPESPSAAARYPTRIGR